MTTRLSPSARAHLIQAATDRAMRRADRDAATAREWEAYEWANERARMDYEDRDDEMAAEMDQRSRLRIVNNAVVHHYTCREAQVATHVRWWDLTDTADNRRFCKHCKARVDRNLLDRRLNVPSAAEVQTAHPSRT